MSKLILPAIQTQWPMVRPFCRFVLICVQIDVYGVALLPDSCALAVRLCKVNALDPTNTRLLQELNMRVLRLIVHTLGVISDCAYSRNRATDIVSRSSVSDGLDSHPDSSG